MCVPPQNLTIDTSPPIAHRLRHPKKDADFNMPMVEVSGPEGATLVFRPWTSADVTTASQHLPNPTTSDKRMMKTLKNTSHLTETFNTYSGLTPPDDSNNTSNVWEIHLCNSFLNGLKSDVASAVRISCIGYRDAGLSKPSPTCPARP